MVHLFGVNIDANKRLPAALQMIYGISDRHVDAVCAFMGINKSLKLGDLTETQVSKMCRYIEQHYLIEGELRKNLNYNIKRLVDIKSYRGLRHVNGLPVRGQRTHTNAKTQKQLAKKRSIKVL